MTSAWDILSEVDGPNEQSRAPGFYWVKLKNPGPYGNEPTIGRYTPPTEPPRRFDPHTPWEIVADERSISDDDLIVLDGPITPPGR